MLINISRKMVFGFIFLLSWQLQAQEKKVETITIPIGEKESKKTTKTEIAMDNWVPTTSFYLELGGKAFYSLNVDFRKRKNFAFSLGFSYYMEDGNSDEPSQSMFFPSAMGYYLIGKRHSLELGGGLFAGFGSTQVFSALAISGVAGYRYQKKKGLIFRAGFTPFIGIPVSGKEHFAVVPWAGISIVYSF